LKHATTVTASPPPLRRHLSQRSLQHASHRSLHGDSARALCGQRRIHLRNRLGVRRHGRRGGCLDDRQLCAQRARLSGCFRRLALRLRHHPSQLQLRGRRAHLPLARLPPPLGGARLGGGSGGGRQLQLLPQRDKRRLGDAALRGRRLLRVRA
jgi:hypothetical protein